MDTSEDSSCKGEIVLSLQQRFHSTGENYNGILSAECLFCCHAPLALILSKDDGDCIWPAIPTVGMNCFLVQCVGVVELEGLLATGALCK